MCNKTLFKLILHANSNNSSRSLSNIYFTNRNHLCQIGYNLNSFKAPYRSLFSYSKALNSYEAGSTYCTLNALNSHSNPVLVGSRSYSAKKPLPKIMDFPQVVYPSLFKTVRNWILSNFIIMRYFDEDFNLNNFVEGSKQAVEVVAGLISRGELDALVGLVTPEVISQVKESMNEFSLKQRQEFAIKADDIFFSFPYEVGVMFPNEDNSPGENQSRFVEITMCYHAILGLKELKEFRVDQPVKFDTIPEYQEKLFICNYRFIREFTKGVQDDWTINAINHFKPAAALRM